jgi:5-(hydroxymethyl)furfural/furfural oxidase
MMDRLKFDDVVVGGGAAGRVLANRSRPADDGALIEAGMDTPPDATRSEILDSYAMPLFFGDKYIWSGLFEPPKDVYEQGRVMKGGSSINVQSGNRGLPRDYGEWRDLGVHGWGREDVLPYFRLLDHRVGTRGDTGELHGACACLCALVRTR